MTIKIKLYLVGFVALLGLSVIFAANQIGSRIIDDTFVTAQHIQKSETYLLEARRYEKDFLLRKDATYRDKLDEAVTISLDNLAKVAEAEPELLDRAQRVRALLQQYQQEFAGLADGVEKLGLDENTGLSGVLRTAIHTVEALIAEQHDDSLMAAMLMLRRHEKDFMLRLDGKYLDKFAKEIDKMQAALEASTMYDADAKDRMNKLLSAYHTAFDEYGTAALASKGQLSVMRNTIHATEPFLEELIISAQALLDAKRTKQSLVLNMLEIFTGLALVVLIFWVIRSVVTDVARLQAASRRVAGGEYDACSQITFSGELESLRLDIVRMVEVLKTSMEQAEMKSQDAFAQSEKANAAMLEAHREKEHAASLLATMREVAGQAADIAKALTEATLALSVQSAHIKQGAEQQRHQTMEVATAMAEMNSTVLEVSNHASHAADGADQARHLAQNGASIVGDVVRATTEAHTKSVALTSSLDALGERAESIGQIMGVITDIADQTNLLALNAAIEAARAGDAGRGFAVVADEVRKLAEKTMNATGEVRSAIQGIQEGTKTNISAMYEASAVIQKSTDLTQSAGEALTSIVEIVHSTAGQMTSIATAAEEQSAASEQIARSTEEITNIAVETSQNTALAAEAIVHLTSLTKDLNHLIERLNAVKS